MASNAPQTPAGPRRSGRIASRNASMTGALSTAQTRRTGPASNLANSPLVNIPTRNSTAYGGRSTHIAQRPDRPEAGRELVDVFEPIREQSAQPDSPLPLMPPPSAPPVRRRPRTGGDPTGGDQTGADRGPPASDHGGVQSEEEVEIHQWIDDQPPRRNVAADKSFGPTHEEGIISGPISIKRRTRTIATTFRRAIWDFVTIWFMLLLLAALICATAGLFWFAFKGDWAGTLRTPSTRTDPVRDASSISGNLNIRLTDDRSLADDRIIGLGDDLPQFIALKHDKGTGDYIIPEHVWSAIEVIVDKRRGQTPEPVDNFLTRNDADVKRIVDQQLREFLGDRPDYVLDRYRSRFETMADESVKQALTSQGIIDKQAFLELMDTQFRDFREELEAWRQKLYPAATVAISRAQQELIAKLPANDFTSFLAWRGIANAELSLSRVNYFSGALGARIIPKFTSPTADHRTAAMQRGWDFIAGRRAPFPPVKVLTPWAEADHAWCAAPTTNSGKLSVGITASHAVYPRALTVENVPKSGTPDITTAPKWVELWAELDDPDHVAFLTQAGAHLGCQARHRQNHRMMACLGRFFYDIYAQNYVQTFDLDPVIVAEKIGIRRTVLTVTSNWGAENTCLYRARLHGLGVEVEPVPTDPEEL